MPPLEQSRHIFTTFLPDDEERLYLTARKPFGFQSFGDTVQHVVQEGDTLFSLAGRYLFDSLLWWVIADFQPEPIQDPTIRLDQSPGLGKVVYVPSTRRVNEEIFNELRRSERI
jgi:hypothetical protein